MSFQIVPTNHSVVRQMQRTVITIGQICDAIEEGMAVLVFEELDKAYLMLYSIMDKAYFCIVISRLSNQKIGQRIVTVLPMEYPSIKAKMRKAVGIEKVREAKVQAKALYHGNPNQAVLNTVCCNSRHDEKSHVSMKVFIHVRLPKNGRQELMLPMDPQKIVHLFDHRGCHQFLESFVDNTELLEPYIQLLERKKFGIDDIFDVSCELRRKSKQGTKVCQRVYLSKPRLHYICLDQKPDMEPFWMSEVTYSLFYENFY